MAELISANGLTYIIPETSEDFSRIAKMCKTCPFNNVCEGMSLDLGAAIIKEGTPQDKINWLKNDAPCLKVV